jgi:hypothetical protein
MRSFLFVLLIVFIVSCKDDNVIKLGTITGNVSTLNGDTAIDGARITTVPVLDTVFTDSKGNFTINNVVPGQYTITAQKENFDDGVVPVIVTEGNNSNLIFKLSRSPFILPGLWTGKIQYYSIDYPLGLYFSKITTDSVYGQMTIDFSDGTIVFPIHTYLYFENDSIHFDLSYTWGTCHAIDMSGSFVNKNNLKGNWQYQCIGSPTMTAPWSASRAVK